MSKEAPLRDKLVAVALEWQHSFGVAPHITSAISEFDAARLVGMPIDDYSAYMQEVTAVQAGTDFEWGGIRYQIKANRPSGKPGSKVTLVPKAKNFEWDYLIWILYDTQYEIVEAWKWPVDKYRESLAGKKRLSPRDYRMGTRLV